MNKMFNLGSKRHADKMGKTWLHPSDVLLKGHIVYLVKFLGEVAVDQPKGTEVVKDAIRKMKFSKQIKKAEGQKPPKVEIAISVDGVTLQDPKSKVVQKTYPLHRISYCADDKSDKRMLTFIAKESEGEQHYCYVLDSEKCAEEITLTIGQAFDLAYRKFLESQNKSSASINKVATSQIEEKVQQLTKENLKLKARVADLERLIDPVILNRFEQGQNQDTPVVGTRLENLLLDESGASGAANGSTTSLLAAPPPLPNRPVPTKGVDLFGSTPFQPKQVQLQSPPAASVPAVPPVDPFGMGDFVANPTPNTEKELMAIHAGFSQGLMVSQDFSLAELDPLNA